MNVLTQEEFKEFKRLYIVNAFNKAYDFKGKSFPVDTAKRLIDSVEHRIKHGEIQPGGEIRIW